MAAAQMAALCLATDPKGESEQRAGIAHKRITSAPYSRGSHRLLADVALVRLCYRALSRIEQHLGRGGTRPYHV
jgi:hypothetical protein